MASTANLPSQAELARRLGISQQAVSKWRGRVPAEKVLAYAEATGWKVTPHDLRPDLYPSIDDGLPASRRQCACESRP